ncbi:hypothetical protein [Sphingomonas oligophenolica]|uniref:Uncharacterized protein n=1 Tax=Sphingomonas oligophenolica TaxID=301154 RepID=A0A502C3A1_9SPHN|nr:hypothetical protein [Sphingomonas oligophenolica]TPG07222.1 hypothetical protein EAH84_14580 [Sphingomonas oligophenolica]
MIKPPSIARFEQYYWGSVILGLINSVLTWSDRAAVMAVNPMFATMSWLMPVMAVIGLIIAILLWYFIVRSPSVVAKWVIVVFAVLGAIGLLFSLFALARNGVPNPVPVIITVVVNLLYIAAALMLFKPDSRAWLGEELGEGVEGRDEAPLP